MLACKNRNLAKRGVTQSGGRNENPANTGVSRGIRCCLQQVSPVLIWRARRYAITNCLALECLIVSAPAINWPFQYSVFTSEPKPPKH